MQMPNLRRRVAATGLALAVGLSLGIGSASAVENPTGASNKLPSPASASPASTSGASMMAAADPTFVGSKLNSGQSLTANTAGGTNQALLSNSGQHALVIDGYAGKQYGIVLTGWTGDPFIVSKVNNPTGADVVNTLIMQTDGNLVLYSKVGSNAQVASWASNTSGNPGATVTLQDDRNLVVYSSAGKALWSSSRTLDTLTSYYLDSANSESGVLDANWYLVSQNRQYKLTLQSDGNLVLYGTSPSRALWSSATYGNPNAHLVMQTDGNLVLYSSAGKALWSTGVNPNKVGANVLWLQNDGNLVKYYYTDQVTSVRWQTKTAGK